MAFQLVERDSWRLSTCIAQDRANALLHTPFEAITRLFESAVVVHCDAEPQRNGLGSRLFLALRVAPTTVDLFHSGAGGYRAQFFISDENGDSANRYFVDCVRALFAAEACRSNSALDPRFVDRSLQHSGAKCWIHEGAWLSDNRKECQNLIVERWERNAPEVLKKQLRFEPSWARLTPIAESIVEIKGGWLDRELNELATSKALRSREIYDHGYT